MNCPHLRWTDADPVRWCCDCGAITLVADPTQWREPASAGALVVLEDMITCPHLSPIAVVGSVNAWCRPCGALRAGTGEWIPARAMRDAEAVRAAMGKS